MKFLLSFLLLFPFVCSAQSDDPVNKKGDGILKLTHSNKTWTQPAAKKDGEKKKLKDDEVYKGDVKFEIGSNLITCDSAIFYKNENKVSAYNVTVSNPVSFVIKGDNLLFDKTTAQSVLKSGISLTAMNGELIGTSDMVELDFSYEIYRMVNGVLVQPKKEGQ